MTMHDMEDTDEYILDRIHELLQEIQELRLRLRLRYMREKIYNKEMESVYEKNSIEVT